MTRTITGGVFAVAGGVVGGWGEWQQSKSWTKTLAVGAADTAINLGAMMATDAATGFLVGTVLGPGVGSAVGFVVGGLAAVGTYFAEKYLTQAINDWSGAVTSNVSKAADAVGHVASRVAGSVGHAVSSAWNSFTSLF